MYSLETLGRRLEDSKTRPFSFQCRLESSKTQVYLLAAQMDAAMVTLCG